MMKKLPSCLFSCSESQKWTYFQSNRRISLRTFVLMAHSEHSAISSDDSIPTRETLLERIKNLSDDSSWLQFYSLYESLILNSARKKGLTPEEAADAMQETMIAVAGK